MTEHIKMNDVAPWTQFEVDDDNRTGPWTYPFPIFDESDLYVYYADTEKDLSTHYTVSGIGETEGGFVNPVAGQEPEAGTFVTILRTLPIQRTSDFEEAGTLSSSVLNDELDRIVAMVQQVNNGLSRVIQLAATDPNTNVTLPNLVPGSLIGINEGADGLELYSPTSLDLTTVSAFIASLFDAADAASARATLELTIGTHVLAPDGDGSSLSGIGGADQAARDMAITAFIMADDTSGTQGPIFGDAFTSDSLATKTNATYDADGDYYHNPGTLSVIARGSGTHVGDMTSQSGLAAAFDGTGPDTFINSAVKSGAPSTGFIGKDWGSGVSKTVAGIKLWAPTSDGFQLNDGNTFTVTLKGSDSTPLLGGGTSLGSDSTIVDSNSHAFTKLSGFTTTTAYRYHWVELDFGADAGDISVAELEFYEVGPGDDKCTGGTALSINDYSGQLNTNAFDDTTATYWMSGTPDAADLWIGYDLGAGNEAEITKARYDPDTYDYSAHTFHLDFSDNGSDWTSAGSASGGNAAPFDIDVSSPGSHQYWRVRNASVTAGRLRCFELSMFAPQTSGGMILQPATIPLDIASPSDVSIYAVVGEVNGVDASAKVRCRVSIDNGTNFTSAAVAAAEYTYGSDRLLRFDADVSGQTGTGQLIWEIETLGGDEFQIKEVRGTTYA